MPKAIIWTHAMYAAVDAQSIPASLAGRRNVYSIMKECERQYVFIRRRS